jgi:1,4-dihydroxy-2-naphthoate octaprenyltransferase
MPVFFLAISQCDKWDSHLQGRALLVFLVLHLFIYPASNGYNSYMDQDEGSIGGLKHPPKATRQLFYASILFDLCGLGISAFLGGEFLLGILLYILVSRAYSWRGIRLKRYPVVGFLSVVLFQGAFTFSNVLVGIEQVTHVQVFSTLFLPALASSLMIAGVYPLTQIYQHDQDIAHGDVTISYILGYRGTFLFSLSMFVLAGILLFFQFSTTQFVIFQLFLAPVSAYFLYWMRIVWKDTKKADFEHTMWMNTVAATCMNTCFLTLFFLSR